MGTSFFDTLLQAAGLPHHRGLEILFGIVAVSAFFYVTPSLLRSFLPERASLVAQKIGLSAGIVFILTVIVAIITIFALFCYHILSKK